MSGICNVCSSKKIEILLILKSKICLQLSRNFLTKNFTSARELLQGYLKFS